MVTTLEFTRAGMDMVRAAAAAEHVGIVAEMSTDELIAAFTAPSEPRRMVKPERAAHEGRRMAQMEELLHRGISPDSFS